MSPRNPSILKSKGQRSRSRVISLLLAAYVNHAGFSLSCNAQLIRPCKQHRVFPVSLPRIHCCCRETLTMRDRNTAGFFVCGVFRGPSQQQKHCRSGPLHSCECWLLLVISLIIPICLSALILLVEWREGNPTWKTCATYRWRFSSRSSAVKILYVCHRNTQQKVDLGCEHIFKNHKNCARHVLMRGDNVQKCKCTHRSRWDAKISTCRIPTPTKKPITSHLADRGCGVWTSEMA